MQLACPNCGIRDARVSHPQGLGEFFKNLAGVSQLRCRRCRSRWETSVWAQSAWKYARCPRCYRQELTTWAPQYYNPPRWTRILLRLGAAASRCEACRCNFASFKPRKEKFSRQHHTRIGIVGMKDTPPGEESGDQMP
ncbi:MAG TPA: hypothetical protein VGJ09_13425 [Bryobacteraceae bacterium]|jgi:hypothetical protein